MIIVRSFRSFEDIPLSVEEWDRLVECSAVNTVFCRHFWISSWWQHFGDDYDLLFLIAEQGGQIIGFAPLMIDDNRVLRFIADPNADYLDFMVVGEYDDVVFEFFRFLRSCASSWKSIQLRNVPRLADGREDLSSTSRAARLFAWINYTVAAPYLQIAKNEEEVDTIVNKYSVRRAIRLLSDKGELHYRVFRSPVEAAEYWDVFADQHHARCTAVERRSSFDDPQYLRFLQTLFEAGSSSGHVHFSAVFLEDRPIAFHFGFVSAGRLLWYKPSFDISIRRGSPGIALICFLIQYARQENLEELDFTIGEEAFKNRFSSGARMVDWFRIHKCYLGRQLESGHWKLRKMTKRLLRRRQDSPS